MVPSKEPPELWSRRLLRPVRYVHGHEDASGSGGGFEEPQRCLGAAGEELLSAAQYQGMDHEQVLVDLIGCHERADQHSAAHDHEVRRRGFP